MFGYNGLPNVFRIVIVTESGKVTVTDTITTKAMDSTVYYDYTTGSVKQPELWKAYMVQFLLTCIPTLIIEGIILLLFGFKLKSNWKPFILINIFTQVVLLFTVGITLVNSGTFAAVLIQIPMEIIIMTVEALLYRKYLAGQNRSRALAYGFVANLVSWAIGALFIGYLYDVLVKLM